jgi:1-deoxy-D-xylulose-5-phosphate reductoisomerase
MRRVTILGATGSIGRSARDVILANPGHFAIEAVVGGRDAAALAAMALQLGARFAALADPAALPALREHLAGSGIACGAGESAVHDAVDRPCDVVVAGISGVAGLKPTVAALKPGRRIALANKETLVCAGAFFMAEARRIGATILPLDSEHNAVSQALAGRSLADVTRITLTASGGPFRSWSKPEIDSATREQALKHPNYAMGAKITIDSASLMNKGLELIEAHHIFAIGPDRLGAVIHPQQIVHGLVNFSDGSVIAGMALPNMRVPFADCLSDGRRLVSGVAPANLASIGTMTFDEVRRVLRDTASALAYAHRKGIVHRDVKPSNVFINADGTVKLMDFGIAAVDGVEDKMTRDRGIYLGTPVYSSPEHAMGKAVDGRSDIYSLGIVAYEMLTGMLPFDDENIQNVLRDQIEKELPSPRNYVSDIPQDLYDFIYKACAKKPEDRFQNCEEIVRLFDRHKRTQTSPEEVGFRSISFLYSPQMAPVIDEIVKEVKRRTQGVDGVVVRVSE